MFITVIFCITSLLKKIRNSKVLVVGAGGLGCPAMQYLTASGIGTLGIIDPDVVTLTNLQRQILFKEKDLGRNKAQSAKKHLQKLNTDQFLKKHFLKHKQKML